MNSLQLKNSIIKELSQIDDVKYLQKIHDLINSFYQNSGFKPDETQLLSNNKTDDNNDKENFTDYIKEWIKDM